MNITNKDINGVQIDQPKQKVDNESSSSLNKDLNDHFQILTLSQKNQKSWDSNQFEINDEYEWSSSHRTNAHLEQMNKQQAILYIKIFDNPFRYKHGQRRVNHSNEKFKDMVFSQQKIVFKTMDNVTSDRSQSVKPIFQASFELDQESLDGKILIQEIQEQDEPIENNEEDDERELTEEEAQNAAIYKWAKESFNYSVDKDYDEIMLRVKNFKIIDAKDEPRTDTANKDGGKQCINKKLVKTIRTIGKQILKEIGKKVLSGNFNLTQVSFPIRAMIPKSALEKALQATCLFPLYMNKAAQTIDLIERIKLIICATIGNFYINCSFLKPLNPILGETIEASYADGTQLYAEQITHHPPISYFLVIGPQNSYKFYGYYNYEANAGINSLALKNRGNRVIQFKDGQKVEYNFASEEYCGSFWGTMKLEAKGKMIFTDRVNNIVAEMEFDNVRWKPTDYFQGEIKQNGKRVSKIYGSYMGFIEFDNKRYWDYRFVIPYQFQIAPMHELIKSDHQHRLDRRLLLRSKVDEAQKEKETQENLQRIDSQRRKDFQKDQKEKSKK